MLLSPCTQVCAIDPRSGLCLGCGRTLHEIAEWGSASEDRRREILAGLDGRLSALERDDVTLTRSS